MPTRRRFLALALGGSLALALGKNLARGDDEPPYQLNLPLIVRPSTPEPTPQPTPQPTPEPTPQPTPQPELDAPLLGSASGTYDAAVSYVVARAVGYYEYDIRLIFDGYRNYGEAAGIDWFLAIAQCAHETGSLTSWWSQRPRRNPAGLGVTGKTLPGTPDSPPGVAWAWDGLQWREGLSFETWNDHGVPAHLGRLLAYALRDDQATDYQRQLITYALDLRPLPEHYRGVAPTIVGLNGRWAYPGTTYGQSIVDLRNRMRGF
ncbi:glucosaminidase domain-containing protein [Candidatus Gracilibacteria bacterium]|nr:glucosaminidase domain-containing protein [Candidatus Gracilibacteria bacterium]